MPNAARALLLALILLTNVNGFHRLGTLGDGLAFLLILIALALRFFTLLPIAVLVLFLRTAHYVLPNLVLGLPAMGFLLPFLATAVVTLPIRSARAAFRWVRFGQIDRVTESLMVLTSALATIALIVWARWTDNLGTGESMMRGFLSSPRWLVAGVGIPIFALVNAVAEEVVYRGVAQETLSWYFTPPTTILLQASAFAAAHVLFGFPNGLTGYLMVFVYGAMLGYLRHRSRGLFAPYLTHVLGDLTIGWFLYFHALGRI